MPRYIIERTLPGLDQMTPEAFEEAARVSIDVAARLGVVWIRSYVSEAAGKIYCEYEAPNPAAILEHARLAGLPADNIAEVTMEIAPAMFV